MAARPALDTRGFGGEAPIPPLSALAARMADLPRTEADLVTLRLYESVRPQVEAGIGTVAGGGLFYAPRWRDAIGGVRDGILRDDPYPQSSMLAMDARALAGYVRAPWATMPAPTDLGLVDRHFGDPAEANAALRDVYRALMRSMRDAGVMGHVLLAASPTDEEMEDLSSPMTFFFCPDPDEEVLPVLLEHQRSLALPGKRVAELAGLMDQFGRRPVYLVDPTEEEVLVALEVLDPDHVRIGGLCPGDCDAYWRRLALL